MFFFSVETFDNHTTLFTLIAFFLSSGVTIYKFNHREWEEELEREVEKIQAEEAISAVSSSSKEKTEPTDEAQNNVVTSSLYDDDIDDDEDDEDDYEDEYMDEEDWEKDDYDDPFYDNLYDTYDSMEADEVLITRKNYESMYSAILQTCTLLKSVCHDQAVRDYVTSHHPGYDEIFDERSLLLNLKNLFMKDIFNCFEQLGYQTYITTQYLDSPIYTIDLEDTEGQYLHEIVAALVLDDSNKTLSYEDFRKELREKANYYKDIRHVREEDLKEYANAHVDIPAQGEVEDLLLCNVLHDFDREYEKNYRNLFFRIASLIADADEFHTDEESSWLHGIIQDASIEKEEKKDEEKEPKQGDEHLVPKDDFESLIGLQDVKEEVNKLVNLIKIGKKREMMGMKSPAISFHCVFTGNPGTGKTTVARIMAGIFKELGILKSGHLVETDRSGLVADSASQTITKTNSTIDKALDGVLFINEANTLTQGGMDDDGNEAITTLLKRMEDAPGRLVVILAGNTNELGQFISTIPGLRSQFNRYIHFNDYSAEELFEIFSLQMKKNEYTLEDDAAQYLRQHLKVIVGSKPRDFNNARYIRNLFEKTIEAQANRLSSVPYPTKEQISEIRKEDLMLS